MKKSIDLSGTKLSDKRKTSITTFCEALHGMTDLGVKSIILYGSAAREDYRPGKSDINLLVVLERIDVPILKSILDPVARGRRHSIAPFFITEADLRSSADVFPVTFLAMQESYKVLHGSDVHGELKIDREHIRLRCEQEIKNVLLRLRRHYIMGGGRGLTQMMSRMVGGFLETLRVVVSLTQKNLPSREELVNVTAEKFEFDAEVLLNVSNLRDRGTSLPRREAEELYSKFMAAVDKVAQIVDQMD
jgi:hypothetical protein